MYEVKFNKIDAFKALIKVTISRDSVAEEFVRQYEDLKKEAELPGFRRGRVPLNLLQERFAIQISEEVLKNLVSEYYINALREKQIIPIEHPKFEVKKFAADSELIFTAEFEIKPEMKIEKYEGLKVNKKSTDVEEIEINKAVEYLQEQKADYSPLLEIRPVQEGDFLMVDYECFIEEKSIEKRKNLLLSTKDTAFPENFIQGLIGSNAGAEKQIEVTLPKGNSDAGLAGKKAVFNVKIKEIKKKTLPQVNDEFAKDLGFETSETLKAAVKDDLRRQKEKRAEIDMKAQIIEQLIKNTSVQISKEMIKRQSGMLLKDAKEKFAKAGGMQEKSGLDEEKLIEKFKPEAEKQLKIFFILDKIAQQENIEVSEEEIDEKIALLAVQMNQSFEPLKEDFEKKGLLSQLKGQIRDEKALDCILKKADIQQEKGTGLET